MVIELNYLEKEILKLLKEMAGEVDDCRDVEFKDKLEKLEKKYIAYDLYDTLDNMRIDEKITIEEYTPVITAGDEPEGPCHKYSITRRGEKFLRSLEKLMKH